MVRKIGFWGGTLIAVITIVAAVSIYFLLASSLGQSKLIGIARWDDSSDYTLNIQGFKDGLQKMGYVEGLNIVYLEENAHSDKSKQKEIIDQFKDKKVDIIYSLTTVGTLIAKNETNDIPIVFSLVLYPVDAGLIRNWYASGNNLVGSSNHISIEEQFSVYTQLAHFKKIAFVHRYGEPNSQIQLGELEQYTSKHNMTVVEVAAANLTDLQEKITHSIDDVDATYESCDTLIQNGGDQITIEVATLHKKPSFSCIPTGTQEGALAADTANFYKLGLISGQKAGLLLQGISPNRLVSDVEANEYLIINLKTAHDLGIKVPEYLQFQADKVIQ